MPAIAIPNTRQLRHQKILNWQANKPSTNSEWAEDNKAESLCFKFNHQLEQMVESLTAKLPSMDEKLDRLVNWTDSVKYELTQSYKDFGYVNGKFEGKTLQEWVDGEVQEQIDFYNWKKAKLQQSINRIEQEMKLRKSGFLEVLISNASDGKFKPSSLEVKNAWELGSKKRAMVGTTYYVDFTNGNDANDGLGTGSGNAWANLDQFTENARSAGDICIVRGSMTQTVSTDLTFTSDGTVTNPIIMKRDFGDEWSDHANSAQTYTPVFGSKTMEASASITGISAGDWIYNTTDGDDPEEFAYEVASVSGTTLTLYLPFKGSTGATKTLKVMGDNPIWNTAAGNYQAQLDSDNFWMFQGLHLRGTDQNGQIEIDSSRGHIFKDMIFTGNGSSDKGIAQGDVDESIGYLCYKCRFYNNMEAHSLTLANYFQTSRYIYSRNCLFDGNNVSSSRVSQMAKDKMLFEECEMKNHATADLDIYGATATSMNLDVRLRNCILSSTNEMDVVSDLFFNNIKFEDYDGTVGDNRVFGQSSGVSTPLYQSETSTVRAGGSNVSIKVTPTSVMNSNWEFGRIKILEIPIYATTDSKTYTLYFNAPAANFTSAPTAAELWIELEAWGHASNNFRKITKSTGTIAADGTWDGLSVTVAPAQAGVAYLRIYYQKALEGGKDNVFYVDPIPDIS